MLTPGGDVVIFEGTQDMGRGVVVLGDVGGGRDVVILGGMGMGCSSA
jgi:hypothetical protein